MRTSLYIDFLALDNNFHCGTVWYRVAILARTQVPNWPALDSDKLTCVELSP